MNGLVRCALVASIIGATGMADTAFACGAAPQPRATLHWSEPARVVSPSRAWAVEVDAQAGLRSDENETPVALIRCPAGQRTRLFIMTRAAQMHWGPRGNTLLMVNWPGAGHAELRFFDAERIAARGSAAGSDRIDRIVRDAVRSRLGPSSTIAFYSPSVVSWRNDRLVLSIALQALRGRTGPLQSFCYGIVLDSAATKLKEALSENEMKTRYPNAICRMSQ